MRSLPLVLFLFAGLCVLNALGDSDWIYSKSEAEFYLVVSESATLVHLDETAKVDFVRGMLDFFPRNYSRQTVSVLVTSPPSTPVGNSLVYEWQSPSPGVLTFSLQSIVTTRSQMIPVTSKVAFPIDVPELKKYTQPTISIDSNERINRLASQLAEGEDDLYVVAFKLADWVSQNVEYRVVPQTSEFAQKSSWVLENRIGVCDEITSLFAALMRSVNVPTRYVSGFAYSPDTGKGSPHAWAEVFFPGFGWVPFDVTFGEFGYLDVSHIKLRESVDADVPSSRYEWKGRNCNLYPAKLDLETKLNSASGKVEPLLATILRPYSKEMAFGSYNYLEARIINPNSFYISGQLRLSAPSELEVIPAVRNFLLQPHESKSVYWLLHLANDLRQAYIYTMPLVVSYEGNFSDTAFVLGAKEYPSYSYSYIEDLLDKKQQAAEKSYTSKLSLQCNPTFDEFYTDENIEIECWVRNEGNTPLDSVRVCRSKDCQDLFIGAAEKSRISFTVEPQQQSTALTFDAISDSISATDKVNVRVVERPVLSIGDIRHPESVAYRENYFINFMVNKDQGDSAQNVIVIVNTKETTKGWDYQVFNQSQNFVVEMSGRAFRTSANPVRILVSYYDKHKRRYDIQKEFVIRLEDVNLGHRILMFYDDLVKWLKG
jgi:transglutaminase-like putative cysteine protease